ncbi:unnamed protein product [Adineta steineri]|uniref:Uncharacterized protein n=2 Tax=Adineta steineri TaxID=433720 RepID=A0A818WDI8_9BILA|nr:unnamed protein product [Adineta steineri]
MDKIQQQQQNNIEKQLDQQSTNKSTNPTSNANTTTIVCDNEKSNPNPPKVCIRQAVTSKSQEDDDD